MPSGILEAKLNSNQLNYIIMKKVNFIIAAAALVIMSSCGKDECHDCHYDGPGGAEVELGEYCGQAAEDLENAGYTDSTGTYTVHCGEH